MASRRNGRALAVATAPIRCAVYTRKSTDEGLDRDFNSLDNQRERAEAYVQSQGWFVLRERYDDGGFSGGNIDRPALRRLLADVESGALDTILVYRLDRLSRSLADFSRVHEYLEKHDVALVSVTESINTKTPHGRMMMNVLLSFAQYERELIGERTRHKLQAARRKGKWTGGTPPLGYDIAPEGGRLVVNREEVDRVKTIFDLYIEHRSLVKVAEELNRRGWRKKSWTTRDGSRHKGKSWTAQAVRRLLINPLYIGKQKLGDELFKGEHKAIVTKKQFDEVQHLLAENRRSGGAALRNTHGALLRGLLRCVACDRAMFHAPARSHGRVYRYYRCQGAQKNGHGSCPTKSIPADNVENFVVDQIRRIGADPQLQDATFRQAASQLKARRRGLRVESKRLVDEFARARAEAERLVVTLSRTSGPAADAVAVELNKAQEQVQTLDSRQVEVEKELAAVKAQDVDRDELARALEQFDPIWDVLLTPDRERVLQLLIEKIDYNGTNKKLAITWRLSGFGQLAEEIGT